MTVSFPVIVEKGGGSRILVLCVMMVVFHAVPVFGQARGRYSLSGDIHSNGRLERRTEDNASRTDTFETRQGISLTGSGPIYDARLASFSVTGTMDFDETRVDPGEDLDSKFWSVFSSLSLLSATRFPLGLRFARAEGETDFARSEGDPDETSTTGTSYGATWNANFKKFPSLQVSYDHNDTESELTEGTRNLTLDTARLRLSKRMASSSYELEYERSEKEDSLGFDETGNHGRFSYQNSLSRAWNLSANASLDQEDRGGAFGGSETQNIAVTSTVSYTPNEDLAANGTGFYSRTEAGDEIFQTAGGSANATQRFRISPQLEGSTNISGLVSQVDSTAAEKDIFWSGSFGGDLISTHYETVQIGAGYGLGISEGAGSSVIPVGGKAVGPSESEELQTAHRFNLNLASRTLDPYTLSGDYTYILEQGALDRQTHRVSALATGVPMDGLSFRVRLEGSLTDNPDVTVTLADASATYTPRFNLSLTGGASASRVDTEDEITTIVRLPISIRYAPWRNTAVFLEAFREDIINETGSDRINHDARLRIEQVFRLVRLTIEFRAQDTRSDDSQTENLQVMFTISRPFAFNF